MIKRAIQFMAALAVAFYGSCRKDGILSTVRLAPKTLLHMLMEGHVSDEMAEARLESCRWCQLFYAPLQTCGTPLKGGWRKDDSGCWCFMPVKCRLKDSNCFLYDLNGGNDGWEHRLNAWRMDDL